MTRTLLTAVLLLLATVPARSQESVDKMKALSDAKAVEKVVDSYHAALKARDSVKAVSLLASDVIVLESGHMETYGEYLGHHLGADMDFAASVDGKRSTHQVVVRGNAGWVIAHSTSKGTFGEHDINSAGVELMVLVRDNDESPWKIKAIHWSSRKVKE